jgi:hypothetical protein
VWQLFRHFPISKSGEMLQLVLTQCRATHIRLCATTPLSGKTPDGWSATDAEVASVEVPVDAAPLDCSELLFDKTVNVLVFGAGIVTSTVRGGLLRFHPAFRGRVGPAVLVGLQ